MLPKHIVPLLAILPALVLADASRPGGAEGVDAAAEAWSFKLTPSYYATSHQHAASDINLRANNGPHAVWLGYYQRGSEFEQTRTGYEFTFETDYAKLIPSLQLATHGFHESLSVAAGQGIDALDGVVASAFEAANQIGRARIVAGRQNNTALSVERF